MSKPIVSVAGISKIYKIGVRQESTLRGTLNQMLEKKGRAEKDYLALDNVSFEVQQGEAFGIIGKNGSGKSTLLKILSKITYPTKGSATLRGTVSSLLEVGTGFHPELTGRENIYVNGSLHGMLRSEVNLVMDSIIEFSGVGDFLDTPLKRYSSGMYVRLAFAVAAHLNTDILIVDEVLAVGDHSFQQRCIEKIQDCQKAGMTVIFTSHNLSHIQMVCDRTMLLDGGKVASIGDSHAVVRKMIEGTYSDRKAMVTAEISGEYGNPVVVGERSVVLIGFIQQAPITDVIIRVEVVNEANQRLLLLNSRLISKYFTLDYGDEVKVEIDKFPLTPGLYYLNVEIAKAGVVLGTLKSNVQFDILPNPKYGLTDRHAQVWADYDMQKL